MTPGSFLTRTVPSSSVASARASSSSSSSGGSACPSSCPPGSISVWFSIVVSSDLQVPELPGGFYGDRAGSRERVRQFLDRLLLLAAVGLRRDELVDLAGRDRDRRRELLVRQPLAQDVAAQQGVDPPPLDLDEPQLPARAVGQAPAGIVDPAPDSRLQALDHALDDLRPAAEP